MLGSKTSWTVSAINCLSLDVIRLSSEISSDLKPVGRYTKTGKVFIETETFPISQRGLFI